MQYETWKQFILRELQKRKIIRQRSVKNSVQSTKDMRQADKTGGLEP